MDAVLTQTQRDRLAAESVFDERSELLLEVLTQFVEVQNEKFHAHGEIFPLLTSNLHLL